MFFAEFVQNLRPAASIVAEKRDTAAALNFPDERGGEMIEGFIITILIGIAGAFLAGFLGRAMHWYTEGQPAGFIASIIGAIILLVIYRLVRGRTA